MSGIAGIIHFDGKPVEPGLIEKMTSAMAHRGPDVRFWLSNQTLLRATSASIVTNADETTLLSMEKWAG